MKETKKNPESINISEMLKYRCNNKIYQLLMDNE